MSGEGLNQFTPEEFRDFFSPDIVVYGGQAVNIWAQFYEAEEPAIQREAPYTSKDIDLYATHEVIRRLGRKLKPKGWELVYPKASRPGLLIARMVHASLQKEAEFTHSIPGMKGKIEPHVIAIDFEKVSIRVLSPVALFWIKMHNLSVLPQKSRNDLKHVRILIPCVRNFLEDMAGNASFDNKELKSTLKLVKEGLTLKGKHKLGRYMGKNFSKLLPSEVFTESGPKYLSDFIEKEIPVLWKRFRKEEE